MTTKIQIIKLKNKLLHDLMKYAHDDVVFLSNELDISYQTVYQWKRIGISDRALRMIIGTKLVSLVPEELKNYINTKYSNKDKLL